jgi:hypothetical protein
MGTGNPQAGGRRAETHGDKPDVATQVAALINSPNSTLSDPRIVEELEGIMELGKPWRKVIATVGNRKTAGSAYRERMIKERRNPAQARKAPLERGDRRAAQNRSATR